MERQKLKSFIFRDNYGFVTFLNKLDAYEAMEHGNDDPFYPKYDLSFGGRRMFCRTSYSDLGTLINEVVFVCIYCFIYR